MTPLATLWLPILVAAVLVFIASTLLHTVIPWHQKDLAPLPDEEAVRRALGPLAIPPGDYTVPACRSMAESQSPEFLAKLTEGPVVTMTVRPNGIYRMGPPIVQHLILTLIVAATVGCIAAAALAPGAGRQAVWHLTGVTTFLAWAAATWPESIWFGRRWSTTLKSTIDAVIYGLLSAWAFGYFWPGA